MRTVLVPVWRRMVLLALSHRGPLAIVTVSVATLSAFLATGRPETWLDFVGAGLLVCSVAFAVILTSGVVARDFTSGMVQVWLQKPVHPVAFYAKRFLEAVAVSMFLTSILVLVTRILVESLGWEGPVDLLVGFPRVVLTSVLVASIAFGFSGWMNRGAVVATLVVFLAGMLLENDLAVRGDVFGPGWTPLLRALLFPESALSQIGDVSSGRADAWAGALARIAAFSAAWIGLGCLGVRRRLATDGLARAQGG